MRILVVGGGPGGLYLALLLKKDAASHEVTVIERNARGDTFGWGVVFSDLTLRNLTQHDPVSAAAFESAFAKWDDLEIRHRGEVLVSGGHGFVGISRHKLLSILQRRCEELGVKLVFETEVKDLALADYDLVVASDGVNSRTRKPIEAVLGTRLDVHDAKYIWYGTPHCFERFTFDFHENEHGIFWMNAYKFDDNTSTFNVGCTSDVWRRAGLDKASESESIAYCQKLCAADLEGKPLLSNRSRWLNFVTVRNARWHHENVVLVGDAARTAHFTIGSGTKLAMEDAIALAAALRTSPSLPLALEAYEAERKPVSERFQQAAGESMRWYDDIDRYLPFEMPQFAASLLTRSRKVSYDELRTRDPLFTDRIDRWFARSSAGGTPERVGAPMFSSFTVRGMKLRNRIVAASSQATAAEDGTPTDWHLVHYGSRAVGGVGLMITEMTAVSEDGRITPKCAGMYAPEHVVAWRNVVDFVQAHGAKIALHLSHSGPRGPARRSLSEISRGEMDRVRDAFVRGTRMAHEAGFDMIELQLAHGYLLSSFISPLTNTRSDAYGGSFENRNRFPLEVFSAVRAAWPIDKPISVRISATDWVLGGTTTEDSVALARILKELGCDLVDVSSGGTSADAQPPPGRCFQAPLSDEIRNEARIATIAVGSITTADEINSILSSGRADLCALGKPMLADPYWALHAAIAEGAVDGLWPPAYDGAQPLEPTSERDRLLMQAPATLVSTILRLQRRLKDLERKAP